MLSLQPSRINGEWTCLLIYRCEWIVSNVKLHIQVFIPWMKKSARVVMTTRERAVNDSGCLIRDTSFKAYRQTILDMWRTFPSDQIKSDAIYYFGMKSYLPHINWYIYLILKIKRFWLLYHGVSWSTFYIFFNNYSISLEYREYIKEGMVQQLVILIKLWESLFLNSGYVGINKRLMYLEL